MSKKIPALSSFRIHFTFVPTPLINFTGIDVFSRDLGNVMWKICHAAEFDGGKAHFSELLIFCEFPTPFTITLLKMPGTRGYFWSKEKRNLKQQE